MIEISIAAEGIFELTWSAWKRLTRAVEDLGFAGLYLADHFVPPMPPDYPSLDLIVALTYLADHTSRVRFGSLVAPMSHRHPVHLARQAAALDDLSGGRMVLGVGAGWMDIEHDMFGFDLGDVPIRMDRLGEGLQIITSLLRTEEPVSFSGQFFQLHDAALPGPRRPSGPPILVGASGPKRGLPLVERYADIWNMQGLTLEEIRDRSVTLDALLEAAGRRPEDMRRSFNAPIVCGRSPAEMEDRVRGFRRFGDFAGLPLASLLSTLREWFPAPFFGTPDEVVDLIRAYERVGITEVTLQWFDTEDIEGLEVLAQEILPQFPTQYA